MHLHRARNYLLAIPAAVFAAAGVLFVMWGPLFDPPPESHVAAYLEATARGDDGAAAAVWHPWPCCIPRPELEARRTELTRELAALGAGTTYSIQFIEWWRTCCEPGIIDDPRNAGLARIFLTAADREGREHELVFEVFVRDGAWWGSAGDQVRRDWTLRELYRREVGSVDGGPASPLTEEGAIRSAQSLADIRSAQFEVKRTTLADLKREVGSADFLPTADPKRHVWVVLATGEIGRGGGAVAPWAVFVMDIDEHTYLGRQFGEAGTRPAYFDRL